MAHVFNSGVKVPGDNIFEQAGSSVKQSFESLNNALNNNLQSISKNLTDPEFWKEETKRFVEGWGEFAGKVGVDLKEALLENYWLTTFNKNNELIVKVALDAYGPDGSVKMAWEDLMHTMIDGWNLNEMTWADADLFLRGTAGQLYDNIAETLDTVRRENSDRIKSDPVNMDILSDTSKLKEIFTAFLLNETYNSMPMELRERYVELMKKSYDIIYNPDGTFSYQSAGGLTATPFNKARQRLIEANNKIKGTDNVKYIESRGRAVDIFFKSNDYTVFDGTEEGSKAYTLENETKSDNPQATFANLDEHNNKLRNKSVEMLLRSGPDFMKNKFDVALVIYTDGKDKNLFDWFDKDTKFFSEYADKKIFADNAQFMVRTSSIDVPQMESETYEMSFLFNKIKKVRSKVKFDRKATLKMRLDEPLFFNMFFNVLSNNNQVTTKIKTEPRLFAPFSTLRTVSEDLKRKIVRIDIYVKHQSLMRQGPSDIRTVPVIFNEALDNMVSTMEGVSDAAGYAEMRADDQPFWFFEDVNFLGQTSPITFNRDSADTLEMDYPFLFKRLVLISPQTRGGNARITDQLNPKNIEDHDSSLEGQSDQSWYYG